MIGSRRIVMTRYLLSILLCLILSLSTARQCAPRIHLKAPRSLHAVTAQWTPGDDKGSMGGRQRAWYGYEHERAALSGPPPR